MLAVSTTTLLRAPGLTAAATRGSLQPAATKTLLWQAGAAKAAVCPYAVTRPRMLSTSTTTATFPKRRASRPQATRRVAPFCTAPSSTRSAQQQRQLHSSPAAKQQQNRDAAADAAAAATVSRAQTAAHADLPPLDWNTFFQLRKTRRRIQLTFSVGGGLAGGLLGGLFLGSGVAEPLLGQVPLDPFLTLGLMTFGFAALGWLAGPSVGNMVFYAWKRQHREQMTLKETQFFARIKKNRVDPSASSASNPVPDFYGEKISSVAGYRQWLKDQRAFSKKRTTFV